MLKSINLFILLAFIFSIHSAFAQDSKESIPTAQCVQQAYDYLKIHYPQSFIYLEKLPTNRIRTDFLKCLNNNLDIDSIETFIHEHIHIYDFTLSKLYKNNTFYLLNGTTVSLETTADTFNPIYYRSKASLTLSSDELKSNYYTTYLTGEMGEQSFDVLLDELIAYTHGLNFFTSVPKLQDNSSRSTIDGVAAMFTFVLRYYQSFKKYDSAYYDHTLLSFKNRSVVSLLLRDAKNVILNANERDDLCVDCTVWLDSINSSELQAIWKDIDLENIASKIEVSFNNMPIIKAYHYLLKDGSNRYRYEWNGHLIIFVLNSQGDNYTEIELDGKKVSVYEYANFIKNNPELDHLLSKGFRIKKETDQVQITTIRLSE